MQLDINRIRADLKRLREEKETADIERGYCELDFPSVSDVWSEECYHRHWKVIKPLLIDYASIVLENDEYVTVGMDEQINEWIRELEVAAEAKDSLLGAKCLFLSKVYLPPLVTGESKIPPEKYADMIARKAADYPYSVYEGYIGDYNGDYDAYYKQKREELDRWQTEH